MTSAPPARRCRDASLRRPPSLSVSFTSVRDARTAGAHAEEQTRRDRQHGREHDHASVDGNFVQPLDRVRRSGD